MNSVLTPQVAPDLILYPEQFYINQDSETFSMSNHRHGCLEINYVTEGSCSYVISGKHYLLKKRNLILFDSTLPHRVVFDPTLSSTILGLSLERDHVRMGTLPLRELIQNNRALCEFSQSFDGVTLIHDGHSLVGSIKEILDECQDEQDFILLSMQINQLLISIARLAHNSNSYLIGHVNRIKEYIQLHYNKITCIEEIAAQVGLNKTYLQRIFKEQVGCTVWQFLTKVRMRQAAMLLTNTDISIGDLDEQIGVNSRQNFYLLFRKEYGMSPQQYRKEQPVQRICEHTSLVRPDKKRVLSDYPIEETPTPSAVKQPAPVESSSVRISYGCGSLTGGSDKRKATVAVCEPTSRAKVD